MSGGVVIRADASQVYKLSGDLSQIGFRTVFRYITFTMFIRI